MTIMLGDVRDPNLIMPEQSTAFGWSVAIFSSREEVEDLHRTIHAAIEASAEVPTVIDVIVNGNQDLAKSLTRTVEQISCFGHSGSQLRVWYISVPDKAYAWNEYVHKIWPSSEVAFFVDGYARVMPDALSLISERMRSKPVVQAVSGVPSVGRSAKRMAKVMLTQGGFHGNFYAFRGDMMVRLRQRDIRLPLGIYRTDPTIASSINFDLDPARNEWSRELVNVQPGATWTIDVRPLWRISEVIGQFKRKLRQAQGTLENRAIHEHFAVKRNRPETLPETADELIVNWVKEYPASARKLFLTQPLCLFAAQKAQRPKKWPDRYSPPELCSTMFLLQEQPSHPPSP